MPWLVIRQKAGAPAIDVLYQVWQTSDATDNIHKMTSLLKCDGSNSMMLLITCEAQDHLHAQQTSQML
jgi:hypothetical protein